MKEPLVALILACSIVFTAFSCWNFFNMLEHERIAKDRLARGQAVARIANEVFGYTINPDDAWAVQVTITSTGIEFGEGTDIFCK